MNVGAKLGAYALVLAGALGAGAAVGSAAGPIDVGDATHTGDGHGGAAPGHEGPAGAGLPAGGLLVSQDGYTFVPDDRVADAGTFGFVVEGPDGAPVESYELLHERELHLVVAARDLRSFAHVHPERDGEGHWRVDLPALPGGSYRAFADFRPAGGEQLTLGVDLLAPGDAVAPGPLEPVATDRVGDLTATIEVTSPADADGHGVGAAVTITVRRGDEVVVTQPYLGAAGHLVALRDGDLAYLHVHPLDDEPVGPVRFAVEVPSAGTYALFFDFRVDGVVRTARFVVELGEDLR